MIFGCSTSKTENQYEIRAQKIPITKSKKFAATDAFSYAEIDLAMPAVNKKKVFRSRHGVVRITLKDGACDVDLVAGTDN